MNRQAVAFVNVDASPTGSDTVELLDMQSGKSRNVYASQYPDGKIDWVEIQGSHVIFADEDRIPSVGDEGTRWRLLAVNIATGERTLLSQSPNEQTSWPAVPQANDAGVAWSELENAANPRDGLRVRVWRPGWREPRDVLREITGISVASPQFHRGGAFYTAITSSDTNGLYGMDLFAVDRTGHTEQITTNGLILDFDLQDDVLAWSQRPSASEGPNGAADPFSVHIAELGGRQRTRTVSIRRHNGNVAAAEKFVAWWSRRGRVQIALHETGEVTSLPFKSLSIPARMDADRDLLAFASSSDSGTTIRVLRID